MIRIREVFDFCKWQIRQWKWHDYLWMIAVFLISFDFEEKGKLFTVGITIALAMMIGAAFKWQWRSWKREREELLNTIKEGK